MARASAIAPAGMPSPMMQQPHGMSLQAKPQRVPHPVHVGRDQFGRMLPGQLPQNAAPPFKAAKAVVVAKPPKPMALKPTPTPMMPPPPRGLPKY